MAPQITGYTDSMPYHTGTTQSNRDTRGLGTQYRNIEGLWDGVYDWCDGGYVGSNGLQIILNPNEFNDRSGGTNVGPIYGGYPSAFDVTNESGFPTFFPTTAAGSENTYMCDIINIAYEAPCMYVGGGYAGRFDDGLFRVGGGGFASKLAYVGSRIMELPTSS